MGGRVMITGLSGYGAAPILCRWKGGESFG
jgi:hypothetical protein